MLDVIFNFLDDKSNTRNARVCKQWSDVALNALWYDVDDLSRLLGLLLPLRKRTDNGQLVRSFLFV